MSRLEVWFIVIHSDKKLFNEEANDDRIVTFEWKFIFYLFKKN